MASHGAAAKVRLSDLARMTADNRGEALRSLVQATMSEPSDSLGELEQRIEEYEGRLGVDSVTLQRELTEGRRVETTDVCDWLILIAMRDRLRAHRSSRASHP